MCQSPNSNSTSSSTSAESKTINQAPTTVEQTTQHGYRYSNSTSTSTLDDSHQSLESSSPDPAQHGGGGGRGGEREEEGEGEGEAEGDSAGNDSFDLESVDVQEQRAEYERLTNQSLASRVNHKAKLKANGNGNGARRGGIKLNLIDPSSDLLIHDGSLSPSDHSPCLQAQEDESLLHLDDPQAEGQAGASLSPNPDSIKPSSSSSNRPAHLSSPISILPIELLIQSIVRLDPHSIFNSGLVCKAWHVFIRDEAVWRQGFARAFGLKSSDEEMIDMHPAESIHGRANRDARTNDPRVALRRIDKSWKGEYWRRTDLIRRWKKSRTPTVLSDPRISTIEAFAFSREHHFMLSASVTYGVASRSDPFSGKITKGFLDATGLINGAGIGNPNVEFSPDVTCVSIDSDTSRIIWGFRSGSISLTTLNRQGHSSPRGNIKSFKFSTPGINRGSHLGTINCISSPFGTNCGSGNGKNAGGCAGSKSQMRNRERLRRFSLALGEKATTFASAGQDGSVRIWKEGRVEPLWIGWARVGEHLTRSHSNGIEVSSGMAGASPPPSSSSGQIRPISTLEYDASEGIILAGNEDGDIFLWYGIDVSALMELSPQILGPSPPSGNSQDVQEEAEKYQKILSQIDLIHIPHPEGSSQPIKHLVLDLKSTSSREKEISILSHRSGSKVFCRHAVHFTTQRSRSEEGSPRTDSNPSEMASSPIISTTIFGSSSSSEITALRTDFDFEDSTASRGIGINSITSSPARSPHFGPQRSGPNRKSSGKGSTLHNQSINSKSGISDVSNLVLGPSNSALIDSQKARGAYYERKFVVVGTKDGRTMIYDWESEGEPFRENVQEKWQSQSSSDSPPSSGSYSSAVTGRLPSSSLSISTGLIRGDHQVSPAIIFPRHTNSITSLEITPTFIITGSSDGIIKIYDSLTTQLIRTINDRAAKNAASRLLNSGHLSPEDASRFLVRQIIASDETLVASIGHQTLAWRAENMILSKSLRKTHSSSVVNGSRTSSKINASKRFDSKFEGLSQLKRDLLESEELIQREKEVRNQSYQKILLERKFGARREEEEANGLNEQEALEYALMLSRDEEEAKRLDQVSGDRSEEFRGGKDKGKARENEVESEDIELQEALRQIELAERKEKERNDQSRQEEESISLDNLDESEWPSPSSMSNHSLSPSPSPSPSPLSSPILNGTNTPSRAMEILSASGKNSSFSNGRNRPHPDYGRAFGSQGREENDKVRTVNVPRDARLSFSSSRSNSNLTSPRFEPSSNNGNDIVPLSLNSPEHWPDVSSSSSPSPSNKRSPSMASHHGNSRASSVLDSKTLSPNPSSQSNPSTSRRGSNSLGQKSSSPSFSSFLTSSGSGSGRMTHSPHVSSPPTLTPGAGNGSSGGGSGSGSWQRKPSLSGAWSNGSPSLRAVSNPNPSPSLLGRSLTRQDRPMAGYQKEEQVQEQEQEQEEMEMEMEMDQDLKFALELSLAEEKSRLEQESKSPCP